MAFIIEANSGKEWFSCPAMHSCQGWLPSKVLKGTQKIAMVLFPLVPSPHAHHTWNINYSNSFLWSFRKLGLQGSSHSSANQSISMSWLEWLVREQMYHPSWATGLLLGKVTEPLGEIFAEPGKYQLVMLAGKWPMGYLGLELQRGHRTHWRWGQLKKSESKYGEKEFPMRCRAPGSNCSWS